MTRISFQRNRRSPFAAAVAAVIAVSVVFFGIDTLTGGFVRSYARTTASVAWNAVASVATTLDRSGYFATRRMLVEERNRLEEQLALYEEQSARYRALEVQNEALRDIAQLVEADGNGITARVISSFRTSPYGTFVIGAGTAHGIAKGDIVLTPGGFVLGEVSDLDSHTATVDGLFAPARAVDVVVGDVAVTVEGRGGGNARAEVPRGAAVAIGDAATVPGFGGRVAGIIGAIESASSSATQVVFLRLPHNLDSLRFVYVVPRD